MSTDGGRHPEPGARRSGSTRLEWGPPRPSEGDVALVPSELPPYTFFSGRTAHLDEAYLRDIDAALMAIIETEGPVVGTRAQTAYVDAMGADRVTAVRRTKLNKALSRLVGRGWLEVDAPLGERAVQDRTYRLPDQPMARPRRRDGRAIQSITPHDIIAVMEAALREEPWLRGEALHRATMARLDIERLGTDVRKRMESCDAARTR